MTVDPFTGLPMVILVDESGETAIPVSIGMSEAAAIATEIDHIELERPMTHHLVAAMLAKTGARVRTVAIHDLVGGVFYAAIELVLASGESVLQDARPSDALALALHTGAAIVVTAGLVDKLADRGGCGCGERLQSALSCQRDDGGDLLEGLSNDAFGKWKV